ncbi:MAG: phage polymerase-like protein [Proteobacteria bacterium]|nr:phage polymerase-like protein [Pseudomonadota bacterium]
MSQQKDQILAEMGIKPLWRLRQASPAEPQAEPVPPVPLADDAELVVREQKLEPAVPHSVPEPALSGVAGMDWDTLGEAVSACQACRLCERRKQAVLGVGDPHADWMLVGEGPGAEEDARGEPFVGQAGKLLDAMLAAIALKRGENVYIANAVKCRPPGNRTPEPAEIEACRPYLERQIALVKPKLILAMGRPAAQTLIGGEVKIGAARGKLFSYLDVPVIVTYHPAYLLRNLPDKARAWEDLCFAKDQMARLAST